MAEINKPLNSGYSDAGASVSKRALRGFKAKSGPPSEDIDDNNRTLRQRARMLYMASPVAAGAINTNRTKVIGTGLTLKSIINSNVLGTSPEEAKAWQDKVEAEFDMWASKKQNCDVLSANNFYGIQQTALKSWLMSGDVFVLICHEQPNPFNPYGLRLHLIEADRVCTPYRYGGNSFMLPTEGEVPLGEPGAGNKVYDGVEVDSKGKIVAYHICNVFPTATRFNKELKWTRVEVYGEKTGLPNILHIMAAERPDQYRGVTYLAQVIEPLLQLRRYTESEMMAALVQSFFTAFVTTEANASEFPFNEVGTGDDPNGNPDEVSKSENEYELGPGTINVLEPGENVTFGSPNIPTAGFETFVKCLCRLVGSSLELPYDVLIKEFNSSYSASRGALIEAWEAFKMRREWFVEDFCQPIFEIWLAEAVARGRVQAPGFFDDPLIRTSWCGAKWLGPIQGQLDPVKEANAAIMLVNNGIKTRSQVAREIAGADFEDNIEQLRIEQQMLNEAGLTGGYAPVDKEKENEEKDEDEDE